MSRYHSGEPVPEEIFTHSPILIIIQPLPLNLYQLLPTTTIHSILPVQFTCLTILCTTSFQVLFGLPLGLEPSTSIHFFTQSVSSFCNTCPYHHNLFCCNYFMRHKADHYSYSDEQSYSDDHSQNQFLRKTLVAVQRASNLNCFIA